MSPTDLSSSLPATTDLPALQEKDHVDVDDVKSHISKSSSSDEDDGNEDGASDFGAFKEKKKKNRGAVHFGSVRVRTHELTLGDNPGGLTRGPPLTLAWDPTDSTRFSNVDEFAVKYHGVAEDQVVHEPAHILEASLRQQIAAAQGHSAGSIRRIQAQVHEIRQGRKQSSQEDPLSIPEEGHVTKNTTNNHHHKHAKKGGFLQRLFKSS